MNRVILVTGGTSGFGYQIAKAFKEEGDKVIVTARKLAEVEKTEEELGVDGSKADVSSYADWVRIHRYIMAQYGRIDVLINNAGAAISLKPFLEQTEEEISLSVKTNFLGAVYGAKVFAPEMVKQGKGTIVNVSSICALHSFDGYSVYGAAKAGLVSFSKSLYSELRSSGIRVTCLIPGDGDTNFDAESPDADRPNLKAKHVASLVKYIVDLPSEVEIQDLTVLGTSQEVKPL